MVIKPHMFCCVQTEKLTVVIWFIFVSFTSLQYYSQGQEMCSGAARIDVRIQLVSRLVARVLFLFLYT